MRLLFSLILFSSAQAIYAQGVRIGGNPGTPYPSAILDVIPPSNGYDSNDMQTVYMIGLDTGLVAGNPYTYGFKYRRENNGYGTCFFNSSSGDNSVFGFSGIMTMKITEIRQ